MIKQYVKKLEERGYYDNKFDKNNSNKLVKIIK